MNVLAKAKEIEEDLERELKVLQATPPSNDRDAKIEEVKRRLERTSVKEPLIEYNPRCWYI